MTSKHTLEEISANLPKSDYIPLLRKVLQKLKRDNIFKFSSDGNRLLISAYKIDYDITKNADGQQLDPLTQTIAVRAATVSHTSITEFLSYITAT